MADYTLLHNVAIIIPQIPTKVKTAFVNINAGSFHITETINQTAPPNANKPGPIGYNSG